MEQLTLFEMATPSMPTLDVTRCYTRLVNHATAANMVEQYHYAHRVPQIMLSLLCSALTIPTVVICNAPLNYGKSMDTPLVWSAFWV